eukprot:851930-Rhodomonas_salina.1
MLTVRPVFSVGSLTNTVSLYHALSCTVLRSAYTLFWTMVSSRSERAAAHREPSHRQQRAQDQVHSAPEIKDTPGLSPTSKTNKTHIPHIKHKQNSSPKSKIKHSVSSKSKTRQRCIQCNLYGECISLRCPVLTLRLARDARY